MEWSNVLNLNLSNFIKNGHMADYKNLDTNTKRISYILNDKGIVLDEYLSQNIAHQSKKSSSLSNDLRAKGNSFYSKQTENQKAFTFYTKALAQAPVSTNKTFNEMKSLLFAYSNRSALFLDENLFNNCLNDINTVTEYLESITLQENELNIAFNLLFKLMNRQKMCFVKLIQIDQLIQFETNKIYKILLSDLFKDINEIRTSKLKELLKEIKKDLSELNQSSNPPSSTDNNTLPNECLVADLMSIEFSKEKGIFVCNFLNNFRYHMKPTRDFYNPKMLNIGHKFPLKITFFFSVAKSKISENFGTNI